MPILAPKLPYSHPFAGGYPRIGGQPLPTDPDAIDYLARVAAADGAAVEVGVAMAVDQFIKGCKADSAGYAGDPTRTVWDALKASCILCGARTISGALVPLSVDYGPELVDINGLPTPTIADGTGSSGAWDAGSNTASNTAVGAGNSYPRFLFNLGLTAGRQYRVTGRISSNDMYRVNGINLSSTATSESFVANGSGLIASGGTFDVLATASDGYLRITGDGRDLFAHTIESLSIREDSFTPTPYNFASGDYSRTTGLKGDGATKYIDSNRANNADGQDDSHMAVFATAANTVDPGVMIGSGRNAFTGTDQIANATIASATGLVVFSRLSTTLAVDLVAGAINSVGFQGISRSEAAGYDARANGATTAITRSSSSPVSDNIFVFERNPQGAGEAATDARLAFYSIGSAIPDLAALDNRVTQLVTGIKFHSLTGLVATDYDPDTVAYIVAAYESGGTL